MNITEAPARETTDSLAAARAACQRIAPLWPLQNFVAVNPFLGLADRSFLDACALLHRVAPGGMQMPLAFYREKTAASEIIHDDLAAALVQARDTLPIPWNAALLSWNVEKLQQALNDDPPASSAHES